MRSEKRSLAYRYGTHNKPVGVFFHQSISRLAGRAKSGTGLNPQSCQGRILSQRMLRKVMEMLTVGIQNALQFPVIMEQFQHTCASLSPRMTQAILYPNLSIPENFNLPTQLPLLDSSAHTCRRVESRGQTTIDAT
ncbi:hypothetical protein PoB_004007900 [Plakobranchus ocellatus]|uniref:Uncharacterized protein n=1 Tax=Plakobranchus ocellatus TaxID=259542 RepID=A0AAV4B5B4_9GAST|nr:hypothetical protein PoB_004007900 [Plakobranchus ocellatus]